MPSIKQGRCGWSFDEIDQVGLFAGWGGIDTTWRSDVEASLDNRCLLAESRDLLDSLAVVYFVGYERVRALSEQWEMDGEQEWEKQQTVSLMKRGGVADSRVLGPESLTTLGLGRDGRKPGRWARQEGAKRKHQTTRWQVSSSWSSDSFTLFHSLLKPTTTHRRRHDCMWISDHVPRTSVFYDILHPNRLATIKRPLSERINRQMSWLVRLPGRIMAQLPTRYRGWWLDADHFSSSPSPSLKSNFNLQPLIWHPRVK